MTILPHAPRNQAPRPALSELEAQAPVQCSAGLACISTAMVATHGGCPELKPCKHCGYAPVRIDTIFASGSKAFAFGCPNEECNPKGRHSVLMPSKRQAAEAWNYANAG